MTENARKILARIAQVGGSLSIDELAHHLDLNREQVIEATIDLELDGLVEPTHFRLRDGKVESQFVKAPAA